MNTFTINFRGRKAVKLLNFIIDKIKKCDGKKSAPLDNKESRSPDWQPDCIDVREGTMRFGNNFKSYLRILKSFCENISELTEKIKNPTAENLSDYAISVHGIRGGCLAISANTCVARAQELELAAKAGNLDEVLRKNGEFIELLEETITQIKEFTELKEKE